MSEWQSIESAPRDGTHIVGWIGELAIVWWTNGWGDPLSGDFGEPGWTHDESACAPGETHNGSHSPGYSQPKWWFPIRPDMPPNGGAPA